MAESIQHKLDRVRPPRVQITYDVEIGDAIEMKELPLIVGVMADLSGNPETPLPKLKERKFVEIDRDNFDEVLEASTPRLTLQADNKLSDEGGKLNVELKFKSMEDFDPANVIKQVQPLKRLFEARQRLRDLLTKLDGNDDLDGLLRQVISSTEEQEALKKDLAAAAPKQDASEADGAEGDDKKGGKKK